MLSEWIELALSRYLVIQKESWIKYRNLLRSGYEYP